MCSHPAQARDVPQHGHGLPNGAICDTQGPSACPTKTNSSFGRPLLGSAPCKTVGDTTSLALLHTKMHCVRPTLVFPNMLSTSRNTVLCTTNGQENQLRIGTAKMCHTRVVDAWLGSPSLPSYHHEWDPLTVILYSTPHGLYHAHKADPPPQGSERPKAQP